VLVIKAGGSAITYKSRPYTANKKAMHNLASQLAGLNEPVILIHGVGSYGHPPANSTASTWARTARQSAPTDWRSPIFAPVNWPRSSSAF
jgi:isopentenyl phosphate kinase